MAAVQYMTEAQLNINEAAGFLDVNVCVRLTNLQAVSDIKNQNASLYKIF